MELDSEKFAAIKELSDLQIAIASARVELKKAEDGLVDFVKTREGEVAKAVEASLLASRELLVEADKNRTVMSSVLAQVTDVVESLTTLTEETEAGREEYEKSLDSYLVLINEKTSELNEAIKEVKGQRRMLQDEQKNLSIREKKIHEGEVLLKDRLEMLRQDIERIKGIKLK